MRVKLWPIIVFTLVASLGFGVLAPTLRAQNTANMSSKPDSPVPSDAGWHVDVIP